jgi:formylglycine-generating enzyme required for sulfatase activity
MVTFTGPAAWTAVTLDVELQWSGVGDASVAPSLHRYSNVHLPATLGLVAERANLPVVLSVVVSDGDKTILDGRQWIGTIPNDRLTAVEMDFDGSCAPYAAIGTAGPVWTCRPQDPCAAVCPTGAPPMPRSDGGPTPDASDASDSGSGDAGDGDVLDAGDGSAQDAGVSCVIGSSRCHGNTVQICAGDGSSAPGWQDETPCAEGTTHCVAGRCVLPPPSCGGTGNFGAGFDCGSTGATDCCAASLVAGGTFLRSYDGVAFLDASAPAAVSPFLLDDFEVTVGRFRQFVLDVSDSGWLPPAGSGVHAHLNDGGGLANASDAGPRFETGWDPSWNADLPATFDDWTQYLRSCVYGPAQDVITSWTPAAIPEGPIVLGYTSENVPIDCLSWYEAYAFCIWDHGFLPTEAEWNFAAAGGDDQRPFPWGSQTPGPDVELAIYGCYYGSADSGVCTGPENLAPVGRVLGGAGDGKWGQSDLAGNVSEWVLDRYAPYTIPCGDCALLDPSLDPVNRGGSFASSASGIAGALRGSQNALYRSGTVGVRCARSP